MLNFGFGLLLSLLIILILTGISKARLPEANRKNNIRNFAAGTALWLMYLATMAWAGVFQDFSMPPRIVVFAVLPAFGIIAYLFFGKKIGNLLQSVPAAWPVYLQSFRIGVELLILGIYLRGLASYEPTMEGYNFDMLAGITAPFVAWFGFQRKLLPIWALKLWNYLGLLLLANVVIIFNTLFLKPEIWGYEQTTISPNFGTMPYMLIPGVFMPLAVFLHFFSLAQLRRLEKSN